MKRLTKEPWFGPRRLGWGWSPITWQGWAVTAAFMLIILAEIILRVGGSLRVGGTDSGSWHFDAGFAAVNLAIVAAFCLVCWLTGGRPGGPTAFKK